MFVGPWAMSQLASQCHSNANQQPSAILYSHIGQPYCSNITLLLLIKAPCDLLQIEGQNKHKKLTFNSSHLGPYNMVWGEIGTSDLV